MSIAFPVNTANDTAKSMFYHFYFIIQLFYKLYIQLFYKLFFLLLNTVL